MSGGEDPAHTGLDRHLDNIYGPGTCQRCSDDLDEDTYREHRGERFCPFCFELLNKDDEE